MGEGSHVHLCTVQSYKQVGAGIVELAGPGGGLGGAHGSYDTEESAWTKKPYVLSSQYPDFGGDYRPDINNIRGSRGYARTKQSTPRILV